MNNSPLSNHSMSYFASNVKIFVIGFHQKLELLCINIDLLLYLSSSGMSS